MYTDIDMFITSLQIEPYSHSLGSAIQFYKFESDVVLEKFLAKTKYHYTIQKYPLSYLKPEGTDIVQLLGPSMKQAYLLVCTVWKLFSKPTTYVLHCTRV